MTQLKYFRKIEPTVDEQFESILPKAQFVRIW